MSAQFAVLMGDIVESPHQSADSRRHLGAHIELGLRLIHDYIPLSYEVFRGNRFVIETEHAAQAITIALLLRLFLKSKQQQEDWDVRIGVGVVTQVSNNHSTVKRLAEQLSERALNAIKKERLGIQTDSEQINERLRLTTKFADALMSQLTTTQAQVLSYYLRFMPMTHQALANKLKKSRVNVTQILNATHYKLFELYLLETREILRNAD
ncbi:hypothetical protein [Pseudidiomarina andamanensis]|uniref:Uncharacterized protein n=1 Tax=Pseudidiomarina andamanensis TaxID=1940690 RepID=A0AA92IMY6_9GAMM|nr:hypothetical protein [Pseudidiomarina andamanensis]MDS0217621.1 hypothetical protein [Pseudidiomarina andamanensis]QGT96614.1 hypothetical protein D3795_10810 [Pseudidiomarina andamanensis]